MKRLDLRHVMFAVPIGLWTLWFAPLALAQQAPSRQGSSEQVKVSDKELRAFAKAYVEFHKLRQRYERSLNDAKDPGEKETIQQEANTKVKAAVEKQGLSVESYNRIFGTVNANEELRKKALKLIDSERKKS